MYDLIIPRSVEKGIKKLPRQLQEVIANEHLVSIQSDPYQGGFSEENSSACGKRTVLACLFDHQAL